MFPLNRYTLERLEFPVRLRQSTVKTGHHIIEPALRPGANVDGDGVMASARLRVGQEQLAGRMRARHARLALAVQRATRGLENAVGLGDAAVVGELVGRH